jgi:hypothetical protein
MRKHPSTIESTHRSTTYRARPLHPAVSFVPGLSSPYINQPRETGFRVCVRTQKKERIAVPRPRRACPELVERGRPTKRQLSPESGFPVEFAGVGALHAAFLNESRTRGSWWRPVQEIRRRAGTRLRNIPERQGRGTNVCALSRSLSPAFDNNFNWPTTFNTNSEIVQAGKS